MRFRLLTAKERKTIRSPAMKQYTLEPYGVESLCRTQVVSRRTMIQAMTSLIEDERKNPVQPPQKRKKETRKRDWPRPGYRIIDGKRIYPPDEVSQKIPSPINPAPKGLVEVRLDSGLPPSHRMNTPQISPISREKTFKESEILTASLQLLTRKVDEVTPKVLELHKRVKELEQKQTTPGNDNALALLLHSLRLRCVESSFRGSEDLRIFARSLVDMIDSFTHPRTEMIE